MTVAGDAVGATALTSLTSFIPFLAGYLAKLLAWGRRVVSLGLPTGRATLVRLPGGEFVTRLAVLGVLDLLQL